MTAGIVGATASSTTRQHLSFPKIPSGRIRPERQNQRIIRYDLAILQLLVTFVANLIRSPDHHHHTGLVWVASSIRPDMIFGKDRQADAKIPNQPRAEIVAVHSVARSQGIEVNVTAVDHGFSSKAHGSFDTEQMKALFDISVEQARNRAAFHKHLEPGLMSSIWARDILSIRSNP